MITSPALADMVARTAALRARFAGTARRGWDPATAAAELTVQLGHLAVCVARRTGRDVTGFDDPARPIEDLADELADVALAALSVAVLADAVPEQIYATPDVGPDTRPDTCPATAPGAGTGVGSAAAREPIGALLVLQVRAGQLAEAAMIEAGFRHTPTDSPPSLAMACAQTIAAADQLASTVRVDLYEAFVAMHTDATVFLRDFTTQEQR